MAEGAFKKPKTRIPRTMPEEEKPPMQKAPVTPVPVKKPVAQKTVPAEKRDLSKIPKPQPTKAVTGASYQNGLITTRIEQSSPFMVPASYGPMVDGTRRSLTIQPPYARIMTSAISDFKAGNVASGDEFYIGTVQVMKSGSNTVETTYDKAIVMKQSPASDYFVVLPLDSAKLTFQGGVPLGINLEMSSDFMVSAAYGPIVGGNRQPVTLFAPYVEMVSGDFTKGFSAGNATSDSYYIGSVKVGNTTYNKAILMHESPSSAYYRVIPLSGQ